MQQAETDEPLHLGQDERGRFGVPLDALCRHAVCLGATGSGKTALCLALIEEVASKGVPVIAVDPKGDVGNLLLTFPGVKPGDLAPWLDDRVVARAGGDRALAAEQEAARWRAGLQASGVSLDRIERLRARVDMALFTPGSDAGRSLSIFGGMAPPQDRSHEALRERSQSTASALLSLVGVEAEAGRSREHALLSALLSRAWAEGRGLDLPGLIRSIQAPPFASLGALDLSSYYPERDRFELVLAFNHLLSSGGERADEPLSIEALLASPDGRPRVSILRLTHLSDQERQAFVAALLGHLLGWLRAQPGSSGLRALLFIDEAAGYLPPVANPPTKAPFLTLFKQARSQGLGVVVATQNPADIDYKALSNAGTWLVGRLATARDRQRVREALEGSGDAFDVEAALASLPQRRFLCQGYWTSPAVFEARWTMSYLRGPVAVNDLPKLGADPGPSPQSAAGRPLLPPGLKQVFLPSPGGQAPRYQAFALAVMRLGYQDRSAGVDESFEVSLLAPLTARGADWEAAERVELGLGELGDEPEPGATFAPLLPGAIDARSARTWPQGAAAQAALREVRAWWRCDEAAALSRCGEQEEAFRERLGGALAAAAAARADELKARWEPKLRAAEERARKAEQALGRARERAARSKAEALLSAGAAVLGGLLGGGLGAGRKAPKVIKDAARARHAGNDVERASDDLAAAREARARAEAGLAEAEAELGERLRPGRVPLQKIELRPLKSRVELLLVGVAFRP